MQVDFNEILLHTHHHWGHFGWSEVCIRKELVLESCQ